MTGAIPAFCHRLRPLMAAICLGATLGATSVLVSAPASARGPDGIADVAEKVIDAVVNISTSQTVEAKGGGEGREAMPQLPPGSPFEEFFDDFFKNRRGGGPKNGDKSGDMQPPRKTNSLGSGFIIDASGVVVTNNHVIADADEINVIMNDGTKIKAELVGVNTLIMSPTGGSIGLGFAVPSKTVAGVVDQLRQFGELRRGWLGVRIQQVTDEIAESLNIKPARGALVAGVDDKGPAKPAGIEPGDVVIKFDGKDVKDPKDLSRVVADTTVGKEVDVVIIRKGNEETRKVTLGRLEDTDKAQQATAKAKEEPAEKPVTQKALGLDLAALSKDLRTKYKIKDSVKGVIVTGVDGNSDAAEKRLSAGDVIVEVAQEAVANAADIKKRVDQLKKDGKKSVLLLVSNGEGALRFVALGVQ